MWTERDGVVLRVIRDRLQKELRPKTKEEFWRRIKGSIEKEIQRQAHTNFPNEYDHKKRHAWKIHFRRICYKMLKEIYPQYFEINI